MIDVESSTVPQTIQNVSDQQDGEERREEDQISPSSDAPSKESSFSLLIGGLETEIQQLKELIDLSFEHADLFRSFGEQSKDPINDPKRKKINKELISNDRNRRFELSTRRPSSRTSWDRKDSLGSSSSGIHPEKVSIKRREKEDVYDQWSRDHGKVLR